MNIQWFPGHMAKTRRLIAENLKLVDCVIEIVDSRLPLSSRNPFLAELIGQKPSIILMNKADIADEGINKQWTGYFSENNLQALPVNSRDGKVFNTVYNALLKTLESQLAKRREKGMAGKAVRAMVTGIPNVGKSTLINNLSGKKSAKTGDRPGVTTGKQWIHIKNNLELLDTPGMLWNKFEDENVALRLAFSGAIKDEILDIEEISSCLLEYLRDNYEQNLIARYKLDHITNMNGYELLQQIAKKRGFIISGGNLDTNRAAVVLLDEFRAAKLGRISLEKPPVS